MKTRLLLIFSLILSYSSVFAQQSAADAPRLLTYELVESFSKEELAKRWKEQGIPQAIAPIEYDVDVYEVIYNSCWHDSSCVKASGFYFVPRGAKNSPLCVYHHGTQIKKNRKMKLGGEFAICIGFATDGYAVAFADYLGLGKGEKFHLYHHVETEAYASMDLVRAIRLINKEKDIQLDEKLFTMGYSQGGHATMAFQKVVEADPKLREEFPITASAPMSGAYDLTGVQEANMFQEYSHPGYLPYLMIGFNEVYGLYDNLETVFKSPYDSTVLSLFNGQYSMDTVNKAMPKIPKEAITEEMINSYLNNENFPFKVALRENSTHNWVPKAPMLLCYCEADEQVNYMNSIVAYNTMKELGAKNVKKKRISKYMDHGTCALFAVLHVKLYFDSFMKGSKKGRKGPLFKRMLISIGKKKVEKEIRKKQKEKETKASKK